MAPLLSSCVPIVCCPNHRFCGDYPGRINVRLENLSSSALLFLFPFFLFYLFLPSCSRRRVVIVHRLKRTRTVPLLETSESSRGSRVSEISLSKNGRLMVGSLRASASQHVASFDGLTERAIDYPTAESSSR